MRDPPAGACAQELEAGEQRRRWVVAAAVAALVAAAVAACLAATVFVKSQEGLPGMRGWGAYLRHREEGGQQHTIAVVPVAHSGASSNTTPSPSSDGSSSSSSASSPISSNPSSSSSAPRGSIYTDRPGCGDYCSYGKVGAWSGDVGTNDALREMLKATAYKQEVSGTGSVTAQGRAMCALVTSVQHACTIRVRRSSWC